MICLSLWVKLSWAASCGSIDSQVVVSEWIIASSGKLMTGYVQRLWQEIMTASNSSHYVTNILLTFSEQTYIKSVV